MLTARSCQLVAGALAAVTLASLVGAVSARALHDEPASRTGRPLAEQEATAPDASSPSSSGERLFAADSVFNQPLAERAPLAAGGGESVSRLARMSRYSTSSTPVRGQFGPGYGAAVMAFGDAPPIWSVPADQPRVPVVLVDERGTPRPDRFARGLSLRLRDVPLPTGVPQVAGSGTDGPAVIWQPETDTLWEFFRLKAPTGPDGNWTAQYGGRIDGVSGSSGVLPNGWGARATSLAAAGGLLRMQEYLDGRVDHALALLVPVLLAESLPPATRSDGPSSNTPSKDARDAVSEGARFRLPTGYPCESLPERTRLLDLLCAAARDYGMIVVDRSNGVAVQVENSLTVGTPYSSVGADPWAPIRRTQLTGPQGVLNRFPWEDLQQLAPCTEPRCSPDAVTPP